MTLVLLTAVTAWAQNGKIIGKVSDKTFNEPIAGLPVIIKGSQKVAPTSVDGRYEFNLAPGTYTLEFKYISYKTKTISEVEVKADKVTELNVVLDDAATELGEVVVSSTYKKETVNALYSLQKNNISISDGISAEIIKKTPDKTTSDVLKRVSGTSVQDNKFVIVRGLNDRYNVTTLNNSLMLSTEPDRKAFSFDAIPSNLVESVMINKTASPDMPGDFAGGIVQITTKDIPDENFITLNIGTGFNSQSTFKPFKGSQKGKLDWLTIEDGTRSLPSSIPSKITYADYTNEQRYQFGRDLQNDWAVLDQGKGMPTSALQFTLGNNKKFKNNTILGSIFSLSYRYQENITETHRDDYDNTGQVFSYDDQQFKYSSALGGILNFAYNYKGNKISFKNFYNRTLDNSHTDRSGWNKDGKDNAVLANSDYTTPKTFLSSQIEGEHLVGEKRIKLDWNLNYTNANRSEPDLRRILYSKDLEKVDDPSVPYTAGIGGSPSPNYGGKFYSDLKDNVYGGNGFISVPFTFLKEKSLLKFGYMGYYKQRDFSSRVLAYYTSLQFENDLLALPQDQIFNDENIRPGGFQLGELNNGTYKYNAVAYLNAAYFMFDNNLSKKIRLVWGLRTEAYSQNLKTRTPDNLREEDFDFSKFDLLPSANLTFKVNDKSNARVAYSRTVSRPEFRETSPFSFYDFSIATTVYGNPNLISTNINNVDLKYEWYPSAGQVLSISGFYKGFNNPVEQIVVPGLSGVNRTRSYENVDKAVNYGIEAEVRKDLTFISKADWARNLIVFANAALINSKVDVLDATGKAIGDRPLQGQSPYLVNAGLQFSALESSLNMSLMYNRIGRRINEVGVPGEYEDVYENSRDVIDFQVSKKLFKNNAELKLTASDLLNQKTTLYQDINKNKSFDNSDNVIGSSVFGRSFSLAFAYTFK
ncbi:TonB-dependent receptor [Solitalea longa]|uniref:TonB-dependent receptor n=2 Tax=Solitalea longa TaxID=2079460 RepID=A0A2S5A784_9SPHI|nr:TonB-dependent receptor [Solitalea longa]